MLTAMGPDPTSDPVIETMKEPADVGALVVLAPTPQEWVKHPNQLRGGQRDRPFGSLADLILETLDRLRLGVRVERTMPDTATNLARGKIQRCLRALD